MARKPLTLANWKMAMTVVQSLEFVRALRHTAGDLLQRVDVVLCPPYTALWAVAASIRETHLHLGAQDLSPFDELAHTGEISAPLLAEVGCRWALIGHWEVRRRLGEDERILARKVQLALQAGLAPILLVGPAREEQGALFTILERQLTQILAACSREQVSNMAFLFEPEEAIGAPKPWVPERAAAGPAFIRGWLAGQYGDRLAERVRILYGGSVTPEHVAGLLAFPDVDGLGVARGGREVSSLSEIIRQTAQAKGVE